MVRYSTEILERFNHLRENYSPVEVINYIDFLKTREPEELLENAKFIYAEATKGAAFFKSVVESIENVKESTLSTTRKHVVEFVRRAQEAGYEDKDHLKHVAESANILYTKCQQYDHVEFLRENTIEYFESLRDKLPVVENLMTMQPDVVGSSPTEEAISTKRKELDFSINFVKTFLDEGEELNLESFNAMMRDMYEYDRLIEGTVTDKMRKVAVAGDVAARKTAHGIRRANSEAKRVKVVAERIPKHFTALVNDSLDKMKAFDEDERRKRIIEGSMRTKLFKIIRDASIAGAVWAVNPAIASIGLIASVARHKALDDKVRRQLLDQLVAEQKVVDEKLADARSDADKQKKYQLMRIKYALEKDIQRINNRRKGPRASAKEVKL